MSSMNKENHNGAITNFFGTPKSTYAVFEECDVNVIPLLGDTIEYLRQRS